MPLNIDWGESAPAYSTPEQFRNAMKKQIMLCSYFVNTLSNAEKIGAPIGIVPFKLDDNFRRELSRLTAELLHHLDNARVLQRSNDAPAGNSATAARAASDPLFVAFLRRLGLTT